MMVSISVITVPASPRPPTELEETTMTTMTVMVLSCSLAVAIFSVLAVIFWNHKKAHGISVHTPSRSAVLITGCSRGIGKHLAESLAQRGYTVLGTVRSQSSYHELERQLQEQLQAPPPSGTVTSSSSPGRIYPILLDVTNNDATYMKKAVESITVILNSHTPPLQLVGIINNAGINPEAEQWTTNGDTPPNALSDPRLAEQVLSTNVLGCIRITHAFVPLLQQQCVQQQQEQVEPSSSSTANHQNHHSKPDTSSGRIVFIGSYFGSLAGAIGLPHVYYEASKHALEGLADGMRRGFQQQQKQQSTSTAFVLRPVEVSLIKPGNIQTDMNRYGEVGPEQVTQVVLHALESKHPRHRYYPGPVKGMSSRFLCTIFDILPTWFTDRLL
jgi:NAD(P)-dependent dehydrogenase (short-subunit alcohol dehydrogenase family)